MWVVAACITNQGVLSTSNSTRERRNSSNAISTPPLESIAEDENEREVLDDRRKLRRSPVRINTLV
jgi:hypothetical protein